MHARCACQGGHHAAGADHERGRAGAGAVSGRPGRRHQPAARRDPELQLGQGPLPDRTPTSAGGAVRLHERSAQRDERHGVVQHGAEPLRPVKEELADLRAAS